MDGGTLYKITINVLIIKNLYNINLLIWEQHE